jgi:hypothetical protein
MQRNQSKWIVGLVTAIAALSVLLYWHDDDQKDPQLPLSLANSAPKPEGSISPDIESKIGSPPEDVTAITQPAALKAGEIQVCGIGPLKLNKDDPRDWDLFSVGTTNSANERWRTSLLASRDVRAQAVGYVIQASYANFKARRYVAEQMKNCDKHDQDCAGRVRSALFAVQDKGDSASNDSLVNLAIATQDPAVYAMALHVCRFGTDTPSPGSCGLLSPEQWTLIEPDNAAAWLMLAASAYVARDYAGQDAALARSAQSDRLDWYGDSLLAFSQSALTDVSPLERALLTNNTTAFHSRWSQPKTRLTSYCRPPGGGPGGKRHDVCLSLAELFLSKGRSYEDMSIALQIGKHVGWPTERLAALTTERDALMQARVEMVGQWPPRSRDEFLSCDGLERYNDFLSRVTVMGEIGAARDAVQRSGISMQELANKRVEEQEAIRRAAQEKKAVESAKATE